MGQLLPQLNGDGQRAASKIEFTAAHEKIALAIGANVLAFLIEQPGVADRAIVPPICLRFLPGRRRFSLVHGSSVGLREGGLRRFGFRECFRRFFPSALFLVEIRCSDKFFLPKAEYYCSLPN
jgi:hypothetical protein